MERQNNRANQLQFLRFMAFCLIFLWHCKTYHLNFMPGGQGSACAVSFFFILSGFTTGYSSFGKEYKLNIKEIFKELWRKIKKFYPLYIAITLLMVIYSNIPLEIAKHQFMDLKGDIIQLIKNTLLIQSWFPQKYFSFCGVGWFLSSIMFLYLFNIPFKVLLNKIKKSKFRYIILILMFAIIITTTVVYSYLVRNLNLEFFDYVFPPARLGEYLCGMIAGFMILMILNESKPNKIFDKNVINIIFTIIELLMLAFWVKSIYASNEASYKSRLVMWLLPNFALIIVFGFGKGYLSKIFENKYLKTLGDISFECYLIHQMIITVYISASKVTNISKLGNIFSISICFLITIILAYIIHGRPLKNENKKIINN